MNKSAALRPSNDMGRWLDRLPAGTFVRTESLSRFRWPIDADDANTWLTVGCSGQFDDDAYARWFDALPRVGVNVDARDRRLLKLLERSLAVA